MQMVQRRIEGAAAAYNLALGFIPDFVEILMYSATHGNNVTLKWFGELEEDCAVVIAGGGIYGHLITEGAVTEADGDTGISSYEGDKNPVVLIDSPKPAGGLKKVAITGDWTQSIAAAATARTASTVGTIIRPTTHNGYVYECTTAITTGETTEPTWPTVPGETVVDDDGVWTCREEHIANAGELGITIGSTLAANGQILFIAAFKADSAIDLGDVA